MPEYKYRCEECKSDFTVICSMSEHKSVKPCEACGKDSQQVIESGTQFRLTGGGWYETMHKDPLKQRNIKRG